MACLKLQREMQAASLPTTLHSFALLLLQLCFPRYSNQNSHTGICPQITNKLMAMWQAASLGERRQHKYQVTMTSLCLKGM